LICYDDVKVWRIHSLTRVSTSDRPIRFREPSEEEIRENAIKIEQFEYVGEQQLARLLKYNSEREDG
jgi:hypothetical protein